MTVVPFELYANKPRVTVRVNGAGPFDFLVDTGSIFDVVDTEVARRLGIEADGSYDASGAGEATMDVRTAAGVTLALGGLELPAGEVRVAPIDAAVGRLEGRALEGLLGYDFFARFPVELDYDSGTLAVGVEARGEEVPVELVRRHPFVTATLRVGGRELTAPFLVDTGFRSALVLTSPFVAAHGLVELAGATIEATTGAGIGGPTVERVARIERFELGPFAFESVVVQFSGARAGTLAVGNMAGIVGSETLRRFRATFDYPGRRLVLEPGAAFREPFEFDLSGLYLIGTDEVEVWSVVADSPAAEAGIQAGDLVEAFDGARASDLGPEPLRRALRSAPGSTHELELRRGDSFYRVQLELRRLV